MKLLDQMSAVFRRLHYSPKTEKSYKAWVTDYLRFHRTVQRGACQTVAAVADGAVARKCGP